MICEACRGEFEETRDWHRFCSTLCQSRNNLKGWRKSNPDKEKKHKRRYRLKHAFGLTEEDYEELFKKQNGRCAICSKVSTRTLDVDHCHTTGKVRGLLCNQCNVALGLLKDNPLIIKAAYEYLGGTL